MGAAHSRHCGCRGNIGSGVPSVRAETSTSTGSAWLIASRGRPGVPAAGRDAAGQRACWQDLCGTGSRSCGSACSGSSSRTGRPRRAAVAAPSAQARNGEGEARDWSAWRPHSATSVRSTKRSLPAWGHSSKSSPLAQLASSSARTTSTRTTSGRSSTG